MYNDFLSIFYIVENLKEKFGHLDLIQTNPKIRKKSWS